MFAEPFSSALVDSAVMVEASSPKGSKKLASSAEGGGFPGGRGRSGRLVPDAPLLVPGGGAEGGARRGIVQARRL